MLIFKKHKEQISRANSLKVVCLENKDGMTILFDSVKHAGKITGYILLLFQRIAKV